MFECMIYYEFDVYFLIEIDFVIVWCSNLIFLYLCCKVIENILLNCENVWDFKMWVVLLLVMVVDWYEVIVIK